MPSKKKKACHWAMITFFRYIVTDTTLSFNQYIAYDQETAIYQPLRKMTENVPCLYKCRNRLEKYHLLTQQRAVQVVVTVRGKEVKAILTNILSMLLYFFNYPESENELKIYLHHY